jgi:hypothetical protein
VAPKQGKQVQPEGRPAASSKQQQHPVEPNTWGRDRHMGALGVLCLKIHVKVQLLYFYRPGGSARNDHVVGEKGSGGLVRALGAGFLVRLVRLVAPRALAACRTLAAWRFAGGRAGRQPGQACWVFFSGLRVCGCLAVWLVSGPKRTPTPPLRPS